MFVPESFCTGLSDLAGVLLLGAFSMITIVSVLAMAGSM